MKTILILALVCSGAAASGPAAELDHAPSAGTNRVRLTSIYIHQLVDEMLRRSPALAAAQSRARAATLGTNSVRTWEDPTFTFGGVAASSRGPRLEGEGDLIYALEQKLPLFGKPGAARAMAQAEAETEQSRLTNQVQTLRRDLSRGLFKLALAARAVELGHQDLSWLETMVVAAEERYRAAAATQVDVLRLQNERSRRATQLRTDQQRWEHEQVAVNRLLNREPLSSWPVLELPEPAGPIAYHPALVERAARFEPTLRTKRQEIRQAAASVAATRKARLPDVGAGIEGRQFSGDGGFREGVFSVSLSLPWMNGRRYRNDIAREQARLSAAELDAADYQLAVREEIHQLTIGLDVARREALLYRDEVIPRSEQALESARANWMTNRGPFNDLMEARRMLVDAQWMSARAIAEQHQMLADLVFAAGFTDAIELQALTATQQTTPSTNKALIP